jgi:UDP-N-acetyl-D-glucosamine dehydrogenase
VMESLLRRGADLSFHDPYVREVTLDGGRTLPRSELTQRLVATADCVAILTPHSAYELDWIADNASMVFDSRNAFGSDRRKNVVRL